MMRLTCEMCGSTDLIKQDGVFVCQSCGCKYSVEEAKKMMIQGTVEVKGDVSINTENITSNYLKLAQNALEVGEKEAAFQYASKIIEIDTGCTEAWIIKMKSYRATIGDPHIEDIRKDGKSAIRFSRPEKTKEIEFQIYDYYLDEVLSALNYATLKMSDTRSMVDAINSIERARYETQHSLLSTAKKTELFQASDRAYKNIIADGIEGIAEDLNLYVSKTLQLLEEIPDEIFENPEQENKMIRCSEQYQRLTEAYQKRLSVGQMTLRESTLRNRREIADGMMKRAKSAAENKRRAEKVAYWDEHKEEFENLQVEYSHINDRICALENQIKAMPEQELIVEARKESAFLSAEIRNLGPLKFKQKKQLQDKLLAVNAQKELLTKKLEDNTKDILHEINLLKKQSEEIRNKLY